MDVSLNDTHTLLNGYPYNTEYAEILLPVTIILSVCAAVGATGNIFVLMVYLTNDIAKRETTYFVPFLAVFDLMACTLLATSSIIQNSFFVYYPSSVVCKTMLYIVMFSSGTSAGFLFVIALQRYLKVCRTGKTMNLFWRRLAAGLVIIGHLVLNIPTLVIAGSVEVPIDLGEKMVGGQACRLGTGRHPQLELLIHTSVLVWVFLVLIATIGLYIPIGCIVHRRKWQNKVSPERLQVETTSSQRQILTNTKHCEHTNTADISEGGNAADIKSHVRVITVRSSKTVDILETSRSRQLNITHREQQQSSQANSKSRKAIAAKNFNRMLTTIVITYAISYFPSCTTLIVSGLIGNNIYSFSAGTLNAYRVLQNFSMINHIVNPFIYVYFDLKFRSIIKGIVNIGQ